MNKTINKQEALQRLANLEKEAQALREIIEKSEEVGSILSKEAGEFRIDGSFGAFITGNLFDITPAGNNHFSTFEEAQDWAQAIDTLIALRRQEGSCKAVDKEVQFNICTENNELRVNYWKSLNYKLPTISPCFISEEYALQAIANIGEEKIMYMFKTFHGITE